MLDAKSILPIGAILAGAYHVPASDGLIGLRRCVIAGSGGYFEIDYSHVPKGSVLLTRNHFASGGKTVGADDHVWDIMPDKMVRRLAFADFIRDADLLAVRRLNGAPLDAKLLQGHIEDQAHCDYPSFAQAGTILAFVRMMSSRRVGELRFRQNELICSTFVDRILRLAADREILPEDRPPLVLPGHFARSGAFSDVPMIDRVFRLA